MNDNDIDIFINALAFSAEKHRYQRRKDRKKSAYIIHPIQVVEQLRNVGGVGDMNIIVTALLHDVLEDTATKDDEIETRFGSKILAIVKEVTDDKKLSSETRKRLQVETATNKSFEARTVKLADKICNVRDIRLYPPPFYKWSHQRKVNYINWAKQVVDQMRGTNKALEDQFDAEYSAALSTLEASS